MTPTASSSRMAMPLHPIHGTRAVGQGAERMRAVGAVSLVKPGLQMLLMARITGQCLTPAALHHVDPFGWFGTLTDHPEGTHRVVDRLGVTQTLVLTDAEDLVEGAFQKMCSHHPSGAGKGRRACSSPITGAWVVNGPVLLGPGCSPRCPLMWDRRR